MKIEKIYFEFLEGIDYYAQLFLRTNIYAQEIINNLYFIGGFVRRKDLKEILFNSFSDKKFNKLIQDLIQYDLVYLDKNYSANILLTSKALSILNEKKIKNKISTNKISQSTLSSSRFLLKLNKEYNYIKINDSKFKEEFINIHTDHYINHLEQREELVENLKNELIRERLLLIDINTIAIDITSIFMLKIKLKDMQKLDLYLSDINTIILNKDYIEKIEKEELEELNRITKQYRSIYPKPINYIVI